MFISKVAERACCIRVWNVGKGDNLDVRDIRCMNLIMYDGFNEPHLMRLNIAIPSKTLE